MFSKQNLKSNLRWSRHGRQKKDVYFFSSIMATRISGSSPNKRRKYVEAFKAEALRRALAVRRPPAGLIAHSDQGSQYTSTRFKQLLTHYGAQQSMSRRGNCYDNAHAESF